MHLKLVASMKTLNSRQHLYKEGTVTEKLYGSIHHIRKRKNQHQYNISTTH